MRSQKAISEGLTQVKNSPLFSKQSISWGLWDWGSASFNAIMTTFVFNVYLVSSNFGDEQHTTSMLSWGLAISGAVIALTAPMTGLRADRSGRRKMGLAINTYIVVALMALCFFIMPRPEYLIPGIALLAIANIFFEFANVNYNSMLHQISTRKTIGRISGFGWAMGYLGGIFALAFVLFAFIQPDPGLFGITHDDYLHVRTIALFSAVWFGLFAIPVLLFVPELEPRQRLDGTEVTEKVSIVDSYKLLFRKIRDLFRSDPNTIKFLFASAIFRDGLAAVFVFGGVIATNVYSFEASEIIYFAIISNVIAAIGAWVGGYFDDWVGPKAVIMGSLIGLIASGSMVLLLGAEPWSLFGLEIEGKGTFWIFGLCLTLFVGPAQASSRAFLSRLANEEEQGEIFGLYATTGRAVSFLAPLAFGFFVAWLGSTRFGIIGIILVMLLGLMLLMWVKRPEELHEDAAVKPTI